MEAARRNADLTLIVLNNLLYGMTGGQMSGLSTPSFKEEKHFPDDSPPFDVVQLAHLAGAAFSARVVRPGDFVSVLKDAIHTRGFSLVELACLCPSHGAKKLDELESFTEEPITLHKVRKEWEVPSTVKPDLFQKMEAIRPEFSHKLTKPLGILLAGAAGGGVQSAGQLLVQAGMLCGLNATLKGEYPITVGTGFSLAEVILSPDEIHFSGLEKPDVILAVATEGWNKVKGRIGPESRVIALSQLETGATDCFLKEDFITKGGKKGAIVAAMTAWLQKDPVIPLEALAKAAGMQKHGDLLLPIILKELRVLV
jgi:Pyruvate/2-oxoacid:ferredoxin oxidoreductase gamma subunit